MKKSVYSIVLADDIIKAVDREAARSGTSRSNLINQILAERLSCITPEMRMRDIFGSLSALTEGNFQIERQRSASLMILRTALDFKYRPTINYRVELERSPEGTIGTLRVSIRTMNSRLVEMFESFFLYWRAMESVYLQNVRYDGQLSEIAPAYFARKLLNTGLDHEDTAKAISCYLDTLNRALQTFFSDPSCLNDYSPWLEEQYRIMTEKFII